MYHEFDDLHDKVMFWADSVGILDNSDPRAQSMKMVEEVGELVGAILKNDRDKIVDGIGDVMVTIIILSHFLKEDLLTCLSIAHQEISSRTGMMEGGVFIKDQATS